LYFPDGHALHVATFPINPGLHVQSANDLLPAGDVAFAGHEAHEEDTSTYVPGRQKAHAVARTACRASSMAASSTLQFVHGALPATVLYVPDAQAAQAPATPENPALHAHAMLALSEYEFAGQSEHERELPARALYLPGAHAPHASVMPSM
jgi:hypothetical protein